MNKEMTIVWHDLREDPNDLPPIKDDEIWSERVLIQTTSGNQFCASFLHKLKCAEEGIWYDRNTRTELSKDDIVAWTYVPNYSNREKRIEKLLRKLPVGIMFHRIKEADKTNEYPKIGDVVIVFEYDENKDKIVSCAGFYKNGCWRVIRPYSDEQIDNVIGWSPFFEANG